MANEGLGTTAGSRGEWPWRIAQLGGVVLAGLLVRLAFIQSAGYRDDMLIFYSWFRSIAELAPSQVYAHTPGLNYPPGFVVLTELSAVVLRSFVHGTPNEYALNVALKMPAIIFDLLGSVLMYAIVRRKASHLLALCAAAFVALNPAIIYDSAYWGQDDSIPTVCALFAVFALSLDRPIVAWPALAFAILVKPPVLVLVPLLLLYPFASPAAERRRRLIQTALGIGAALIVIETLALAFFPHPTPLIALRHLVGQLLLGSTIFAMNSLNAFNLWAIFQPFFVSDRLRFLDLPMHTWGDLLFIAVALSIYWRYLRTRAANALFEAATLLLLGFFLCLTEMHERYLYYAVVFAGALLVRRPYRRAAWILSVTLLLNLEYGLTFMYLDDAHAAMVNRFEFAPWLSHLCSIANAGVFCWLMCDFLGLRGWPAAWVTWTRASTSSGRLAPSRPDIH